MVHFSSGEFDAIFKNDNLFFFFGILELNVLQFFAALPVLFIPY